MEKPYTSTTGLHVNDLMVDLFVASFRLNHRNNQHFEVCFQPDCNSIYQTALIRGLHQIVKETVGVMLRCKCMYFEDQLFCPCDII